jgi:hypothetical protein
MRFQTGFKKKVGIWHFLRVHDNDQVQTVYSQHNSHHRSISLTSPNLAIEFLFLKKNRNWGIGLDNRESRWVQKGTRSTRCVEIG